MNIRTLGFMLQSIQELGKLKVAKLGISLSVLYVYCV